jgi:ribosomal protein S27AE
MGMKLEGRGEMAVDVEKQKANIQRGAVRIEKPCPFCGSWDVFPTFPFRWPRIQCGRCGAIGPYPDLENLEGPNAAWNHRAE